MNPRHYTTRAIALAAALLIAPCIQAAHAEDSSEVAALRAQVQELQRMVIDLQQQVEELRARNPSPSGASVPARSETTAANNTPRIRGYVRPDLVGTPRDRSAASSPALTPETIRENWHTLEKGMSNQEVSNLLGAPTRSFRLKNKLVWYYDYAGIGKGSVMFSDNGEVTDWQEPPTSHWFW